MKRQNRNPQLKSSRTAFSLIELLIVIVIIAILMGLLLPMIGSIRRRARLTQVKAEITRFNSAIAAFKGRFNVEPPSAIVIPNPASSGVDWDPVSRRRIRAIWPQFNFPTAGGIDPSYFGGRDYIVLTGAECLVFFLGGLPVNSAADLTVDPPAPTLGAMDQVTLTGFSKNPRAPFALAGSNRDTSPFEFEAVRFVDVDGDLFPEYVDTLPGQTTPYFYISSYNRGNYPLQVPGGIDDFDVFSAVTSLMDDDGDGILQMYNTAGATHADTGGAVANLATVYHQTGSPANPGDPWKDQSYQLISPGEDHAYGGASVLNAAYAGAGVFLTDDASEVQLGDRDNLTNFNEGLTLGE